MKSVKRETYSSSVELVVWSVRGRDGGDGDGDAVEACVVHWMERRGWGGMARGIGCLEVCGHSRIAFFQFFLAMMSSCLVG